MEDIPEKPQPQRPHRKKPEPFPSNEDLVDLFRSDGGDRFTPQEKVYLVFYGSKALTFLQAWAIQHGGDHWPTALESKQAAGAWADLVQMANILRAARKQPLLDAAGRQRLIRGAKRWTTHFLRYGNIWNDAPHQPGWKAEQNRSVLTRLREILLDCCIVDEQQYFYKNTQDAAERNEEFKRLFDGLEISHAQLWKQLKDLFPGLHICKQPIHRVRDAEESQVSGRAFSHRLHVDSRPGHDGALP